MARLEAFYGIASMVNGVKNLGIGACKNDTKVHFNIVNAGPTNNVLVRGRINQSTVWVILDNIVGSTDVTIHVALYDELEVSVTVYDTLTDKIFIYASGFANDAVTSVNGQVEDVILDATDVGADPTGTAQGLFDQLGEKYVRTTRFEIINSGTSGTVTLPANSTVILDDFGGTVDAVVSQVQNSKPSLQPSMDSDTIVVATTFDSSGNWSFSSTPSSYPVIIMYRVRQTLANFDSTATNIYGVPNTDMSPVQSVNGKIGEVVLVKSDIGLGNVQNIDTTNPSNIVEDSTHKFVTDTEKSTWNDKENAITVGTTSEYWRGDKTFQPLDFDSFPFAYPIVTESINIVQDHLDNKRIVLANTPVNPESVTFLFQSGIHQINGLDFIVVGNQIQWDGLGLDGFIELVDLTIIQY